jgi:hypothetical protein
MPDKDKVTVLVPGLVAKLTKILGQVGGIPKDQKHQQGWMYRSEDALMERLRPLLAGEAILCLPSEESVTTLAPVRSNEGKEASHFVVRVGYTFIDAATGETLGPCYMSGEAADWGDRALQKAQTFAGKAFLSKVFMISCGDDVADGNGEGKTTPSVQVPRKSDQLETTTPPPQGTPPSTPPPQGPPPEREPGDDDNVLLPVLVTSVTPRTSKTKKPYFVIETSDSQRLITFDTKLGELAKKALAEHNPLLILSEDQNGFPTVVTMEWA